MWLWILTVLNITTMVYSFSNGFFLASCGNLEPQHASSVRCTDNSPFKITYQQGNEGEPLTVSLQSTGSTFFKGFMLDAQEEGGGSVGTFTALDAGVTRLLNCNDQTASAASQRNNQPKTSFSVNWTPPETNGKSIAFRATFVTAERDCWVSVRKILSQPTTTTTTTTTTAEPTTTTTTTTTAEPTTTRRIAHPATVESSITQPGISSPTPSPRVDCKMQIVILALLDIALVIVKMELCNIITTTGTNSATSHRASKVSKILHSMFCEGLEIATLVLLNGCDSLQVSKAILIALLCVVLTMNTIELVISCLPLGPSHELKDIFDLAGKVCAVIHEVFIIAFIYVGHLETVDRRNRPESWVLWVLISYTVWILLHLIWLFVFTVHIDALLWGRRKEKKRKQPRQQRKEKSFCTAKVTVAAVSYIFLFGALAFTVALVVGIRQDTEN